MLPTTFQYIITITNLTESLAVVFPAYTGIFLLHLTEDVVIRSIQLDSLLDVVPNNRLVVQDLNYGPIVNRLAADQYLRECLHRQLKSFAYLYGFENWTLQALAPNKLMLTKKGY